MSLPAGYVSRPAAEDDLDGVVALVKACDQADAGVEDPVREHIQDDWRRTAYELDRHTVVVLADGVIVAFAEVFGIHPELSMEAWVQVHPEHRGRGLGAALLSWTEERAGELVPAGTASKLYNAVAATDEHARRLLLRRGYRQVRVFWHMEVDLTKAVELAVVPAGCAIRPYRHERDADAVYQALEEAFAEHWGYEPHPRDAHMEDLQRMDPQLVWVATVDEEVVGALISRTVEGTGWVDDLGVRRPWRGRGIARALLLRAFAALAERGVASVMLNVDSDNQTGATRLYGSVGMRVRRAWPFFEKPLPAA